MRKFRFRFDTVLKQRKAREEEALRHLAIAQQLYHQELAGKARLEAILAASLARREALGTVTTTIVSFRVEQDFITGTKQRIIQAQQAITRASRGVERALRSYLLARRQAKMMETLYDKDYAEYRRAAARKERREIEDLTTMRARFRDEEDVA